MRNSFDVTGLMEPEYSAANRFPVHETFQLSKRSKTLEEN